MDADADFIKQCTEWLQHVSVKMTTREFAAEFADYKRQSASVDRWIGLGKRASTLSTDARAAFHGANNVLIMQLFEAEHRPVFAQHELWSALLESAKTLPADPVSISDLLVCISRCRFLLGCSDSLAVAQRTLELVSIACGPSHWLTAQALCGLGNVLTDAPCVNGTADASRRDAIMRLEYERVRASVVGMSDDDLDHMLVFPGVENDAKSEDVDAIAAMCLGDNITTWRAQDAAFVRSQRSSQPQFFGGLLTELSSHDQALLLYAHCQAVYLTLKRNTSAEYAQTWFNIAALMSQRGVAIYARRCYIQCLEIDRACLGPLHITVAHTVLALARMFSEDPTFCHVAPKLFALCVDIRERSLGPCDVDVARALHYQGVAMCAAGQFLDALSVFMRCMRIRVEALGRVHIDVAASLHNIGVVYQKMHRWKDALDLHRQCADMRVELLGPKHREVARAHEEMATAFYRLGERNLALRLLNNCLRVTSTNADLARVKFRLGAMSMSADYKVAWQHFLDAFKLEPTSLLLHNVAFLLERSLPRTVDTLGMRLDWLQKQVSDVEPCIKTPILYGIAPELVPVVGASVAITLHGIADVVCQIGLFESAVAVYQQCLAIRQRVMDPVNKELAMTRFNLGISLEFCGRVAEAREQFFAELVAAEACVPVDVLVVAPIYNALGRLCETERAWDEARIYYERMRALYADKDKQSEALAIDSIAAMLLNTGRMKEAFDMYTSCTTRWRSLPANQLGLAKTLYKQGFVAANMPGDRKLIWRREAQACLEESLKLLQAHGAPAVDIGITLVSLGDVCNLLKCTAAACRYYEAAAALNVPAVSAQTELRKTASDVFAGVLWTAENFA